MCICINRVCLLWSLCVVVHAEETYHKNQRFIILYIICIVYYQIV